MALRDQLRRPRTWLIAAIAAVVLGGVVAPFVYIHFIEGSPPEKLSFSDVSTATTAAGGSTASTAGATGSTTAGASTSGSTAAGTTAAGASTTGAASGAPASLDGTWTVTTGSQAGYRVPETLFGQKTTAVGRTSDVKGTMTVAGTKVTAAELTVDLTTVKSDQANRDRQYNGRIMNTAQFPEATFTLTTPIELGSIPADLAEVSLPATGTFTIHGVTKTVTLDLKARRNGGNIEVNGAIPVTFADYDIDNPSFGPASVGDSGTMEFLVVFTK